MSLKKLYSIIEIMLQNWGASIIINISCETHGIMYCSASLCVASLRVDPDWITEDMQGNVRRKEN